MMNRYNTPDLRKQSLFSDPQRRQSYKRSSQEKKDKKLSFAGSVVQKKRSSISVAVRWKDSNMQLGMDLDPSNPNDFDIDANNLLGKENDVHEVLHMLEKQPNLRLTREQNRALKDSNMRTFDKAFSQWNKSMAEEKETGEDDENEITVFDRNIRMETVWTPRKPWIDWTMSIFFHVVVINNFLFCLWESFSSTVENAKFHNLYLRGQFTCLAVPYNYNSLFHLINVIHGFSCVTVLHARTRNTASLCWTFLLGTTIHASYKFYEVLFAKRFDYNTPKRGFPHGNTVTLATTLMFQIPGVIIVLLRYYDLTRTFQTRAEELATQSYEGRQLNDKIIYRNVSSFLQRKAVLRSCTSLQIFNTVQRLQAQKKKLRKGQELPEEVFRAEVMSAVAGLKEVEGFRGMEMLKELKRRQYRSLNDDILQYQEVEEEQGNKQSVVVEDEPLAEVLPNDAYLDQNPFEDGPPNMRNRRKSSGKDPNIPKPDEIVLNLDMNL